MNVPLVFERDFFLYACISVEFVCPCTVALHIT